MSIREIPLGLYESVVESANDAVIVTTPELNAPDPKIIYVNPAFQRMTGWTPDEIVGQTPRVLQGPRTDRGLLDRLRRDLETKRSFFGEAINYRKDGSEYYVEWRIAPVEENGKVLYWVAIQRDVSARKRTEDRLLEDNQRKDTFLAMLAHELRNPLAPIRTSIYLLKQRFNEKEPQRLLDVMDHQVDRMVRIMDDLLDISRINRGLINLQVESTNIQEIADHAIESVRPAIEAKKHRLDRQIPEQLTPVHVDPARIEQILVNLLTNAAKYTPDGGRITLRATQYDHTTILQVQDNGQGIEPGHLGRVFDLFYQEKLLPSAEGGLGIGLTLVKQLIDLHHGQVTAQSEGRGRGTTVTVQIPNVVQAQAVGAGGSPRIMLVDDNPDAANTLATLLETLGHHAKVCYRGTEAVEYFDKHKAEISVIFLDLGLPDISGVEVARHIRADEEASPMLVAVTGWSQPQDRRQTTQVGFNFHLTKPVDPEMIKNLLSMAR